MREPRNLDEYTARFHQYTTVTGHGANVVTTIPCPWCAAPGFALWRITHTHEDMARETTCALCGRSGKTVFLIHQDGHTEAELVQTGGPDAPDWLIPAPRRENTHPS